MPSASDFRKLGREALTGNWVMAGLVSFIAAAIIGGVYFILMTMVSFSLFFSPYFTAILICIVFVAVALVAGPINLGLYRYFINVHHREEAGVAILFSRFNIFIKAFLLTLYIGVFVFLWSLLLVVPGIIAAYRYSQAFYLMAQNPDIGVVDAVELSKKMMCGHKGRLFCLHISFIGWWLLVVLANIIAGFSFFLIFIFGIAVFIGTLLLQVYIYSAQTAFFLDLQYHYQQEVLDQAGDTTGAVVDKEGNMINDASQEFAEEIAPSATPTDEINPEDTDND